MLQDKLVSVVMPVYNAERYLKEAVESILQQSYANFEFIIIDDGSSDSSSTILNTYSDARIKRITFETNKGLIAALNAGLLAAKGDLIARMDADDCALPKRLEMQVLAFQKNPKLIACDTEYYNWQANGSRKLNVGTLNNDALKGSLIFTTCFCHPAVMMRNVFSTNAVAYNAEFKFVEDYKLWCDLALKGDFEHLQEPLLLYRSHPAQVSNQHHQTQLQKSKEVRAEFLNALQFELTDDQFEIVNLIGNNEFITSKETLRKIERTLLHLLAENERKQKFNSADFKLCMHKFWIDSCGFSNLALVAFRLYLKSPLSSNHKQFKGTLKLLAKCLLRGTKK